MPAEILETISRDSALMRWLHKHDPDRDMTAELLQSSGTYLTRVPPAETADISEDPVPPTVSIFVPMYRRTHFVLGQLYGPMSPNSMALGMLAQAGYGEPPDPISRRFVADLSCERTLQFIEYEWFSNGMLCVSVHHVNADGGYDGESILLAAPLEPAQPAAQIPLFLERQQHTPSPTQVVMRLRIREHLNCAICEVKGVLCACPPEMRGRHTKKSLWASESQSATSWESWISEFTSNRSGTTNMQLSFTMFTPAGPVTGAKTVLLEQSCEVGVDSPTGNLMATMFLQSAGMLMSDPAADTPVRSSEERRDRILLANDLSEEEEDWRHPKVVVLDSENGRSAPAPNLLQNDASGVMGSSLSNGVAQEFGIGESGRSGAESTTRGTDVVRPVVTQMRAVASSSKSLRSAIGKNPHRETSDAGPAGGNSTVNVKKRAIQRDKVFVCECGRVFNHRGHYNEHWLCVHEKVRQHKCTFQNCQSAFFKRSDRDRHMRSKHDFSQVICSKCDATFANRQNLESHTRESHRNERAHACGNCSARFASASGLKLHVHKCKADR